MFFFFISALGLKVSTSWIFLPTTQQLKVPKEEALFVVLYRSFKFHVLSVELFLWLIGFAGQTNGCSCGGWGLKYQLEDNQQQPTVLS